MLGVISAIALTAATYDIDVPARVGDKLDPIRFPVYYPETVPSPRKRVFVTAAGTETSYTLNIDLAKGCGGGGACSLASVTAEKGARFLARRPIGLRGGITGRYAPSACGASCSAPLVEWKAGGFKYAVAVESVATKRAIRRIANSAIAAGPR